MSTCPDYRKLLADAVRIVEPIRIVFLAANPDDRTQLKLGREYTLIRKEIRSGEYRDAFAMSDPELAASIGDLSSALRKHRPHIVHFCGHGSARDGIVFEGRDGYSRPARKSELAGLFNELSGNVRLVFLNACYTKEQAEVFGRMFDYTIGTKGPILDSDARDLAGCFYRELANGATVSSAFKTARLDVGDRVRDISDLSKGKGVDDSRPFILQVLKPESTPPLPAAEIRKESSVGNKEVRLPRPPKRFKPQKTIDEHTRDIYDIVHGKGKNRRH